MMQVSREAFSSLAHPHDLSVLHHLCQQSATILREALSTPTKWWKSLRTRGAVPVLMCWKFHPNSQTGFMLVHWCSLKQYFKKIIFPHKLIPITAPTLLATRGTLAIHNSLRLQNLYHLSSGIWMNPKLSLWFSFYLPGFIYVLHFFRIKFKP